MQKNSNILIINLFIWSDMCDLGSILIGVVFVALLSSSYQDLVRREVSDIHWWVIGISGVISVAMDFQGTYGITVTIGSVLIIFDILCPLEIPRRMEYVLDTIIVCLFLIPVMISPNGEYVFETLSIIIPTIVFYVMYLMGILKGGADAKCLITLSILFHGDVSSYAIMGTSASPLPFSLVLLFYAALLTMLYALSIMIRNVIEGNGIGFHPWYRMGLDDARTSYVWSKQDVIDGSIAILKGVADEGVYDRLDSMGAKDVLVTPMIPFIIPITISFAFIILAGDPLSLLLSSLY